MSKFAHLHLHTEYSLLDGVNRIPDVIEKVKADGMEAVAMTDHGVMNGYQEFWTKSKDAGIKPILGCEVYIAPASRFDKKEVNGIRYFHLVLLAQNKTGFHNLVKLVSLAQKEGYYYNPRIDRELLQKYSEGIVCTSACLASPVARNINLDRLEEAEDWIQFFKQTFPDRFYLELQRNGHDGDDEFREEYISRYGRDWANTIKAQIKVNNKLREYADKYELPLVATTDAHYLDAEDRDVQKVLFCIQDGVMLTDNKGRDGYWGTYVTTQEEMYARFADDPTPLENTLRIAEQIEIYDISNNRVQPKFWNLPPDKTAQQELKEQTYAGAKKRYGEITPELKERIDFELDIIHDKGYDDYFLVVSDLLKWGASQGILTGTRGSVAGSVVSYALDISTIDPIKWELYFERFLNPERPSPPDIDMDIQDSRREEIIEYSREKYGADAIAGICTFGRFQTKAAIRDVSRVMGIDLQVADKLSKMVNVVFGKVWSIDKQMENDEEFKRIIQSDPQLIKLAETVKKITGLSRNLSIHAAGYLITPTDVTDYTPIQKESRGDSMITQLEFGPLEDTGLMKFDFLGLRTLTILANALENVKRSQGIEIDLEEIPDDDQLTFDLFSRGETIGVFQFESPPMRRYLMDLQPESQEDLTFMAAAYRPGAMDYIPDYILRKKGEQPVQYLFPELKESLGTTYGFIIYQEQIMRIAVDFAGYSMGAADKLRKAMGKKKMDVMEKEAPKFKSGMIERGFSPEIADELWEFMLPFANYGFNKAHAAVYAVLAYKCAYFKAHYPREFMAALMHSDLNDSDRIVIDMRESQRLGFEILPPDVNNSNVYFSAEGENGIRVGIGAIKNVGNRVCEAIVAERELNGEYKSLDDLVYRVKPENLNKKSLECLIMVGGMDSFGERNSLLAIMPAIVDQAAKANAIAATGQIDMFSMLEESGPAETSTVNTTPLPLLGEVPDTQKIQWEKDLLGIFVSAHPLDKYNWVMLDKKFNNIGNLEKYKEGSKVKLLCYVEEMKSIRTKKDNKPMSFITFSDIEGQQIEAVMFNSTHDKYSEIVEAVPAVIVEGKLSHRNDKISILVDKVIDATTVNRPKSVTIDICHVTDRAALAQIRDCFDESGEMPINIKYGDRRNPKTIKRRLRLRQDCIEGVAPYIVRKAVN